MKHKRSLTLAELVETIQDNSESDDQAVAILTHMINTGRVSLTIEGPRRTSVPKRDAEC